MGADYYIVKVLYVYLNNNSLLLREVLEKHAGYFYGFDYESDESDYEEKWNEYIKDELKPHMKDIIIYENNSFKNEQCEKKYKQFVEDELNEQNKEHELNKQNEQNELILLSNKAKYITEILNDTIDLRKKKKDEVIAMLEKKGYDKIEDDNEYNYLVRMPMDSVTEENVTNYLKTIELIKNKTVSDIDASRKLTWSDISKIIKVEERYERF